MIGTAASARRLGQIIRLLSSDKPGEVSAAVEALNRTLEATGLDLHAVAETVERGLAVPVRPAQTRQRSTTAKAAQATSRLNLVIASLAQRARAFFVPATTVAARFL
jgi:hypothetical protein